ncbi:FAD-dependent monooxygenase [Whalleya microplaca]|nr:FAD-dependent monooxygenase [Whalleya microplaca]
MQSIPTVHATSMAQSGEHYQVAIVGAGVAGLTLALAFERFGISYALFEAHGALVSGAGAGVGLQPNGERILEQLGVQDDVEEATAPISTWYFLDSEGKLISTSDFMGHYASKTGYPFVFIERSQLLQILSSKLQGNGLIRLSSRIASIQENDDFVTVATTDGFSVTADMVVGADGVRSCVRSFIDSPHPENIYPGDDYMSVEFVSAFGVSSYTTGLPLGERWSVFNEKVVLNGFTGKDGVSFWFVFEHLGRRYPLSKSQRYTTADAEALCESVAHMKITPGVLFGSVYANRKQAIKLSLEEGVATKWHTHRAVIVGDAAHKMMPHGGQGANFAIEDSAVLTNEIRKVLKASPDGKLPRDALYAAFKSFSEQRTERSAEAVESAAVTCNAQLLLSSEAQAYIHEIATISEEDHLSKSLMAFVDAPVFDDIELTARGRHYDKAMESLKVAMKAKYGETLKQC